MEGVRGEKCNASATQRSGFDAVVRLQAVSVRLPWPGAAAPEDVADSGAGRIMIMIPVILAGSTEPAEPEQRTQTPASLPSGKQDNTCGRYASQSG